MSTLNIILFCVGGVLFGVIVIWLVSNITSRIRNRATRRRVSEPVGKVKKGMLARIGTMNLILMIVGISLLWFTHRMIALYETTGGIPDTLVQCVFAVLGGECGVMGWIKTTKDKRQDRKWSEEDRIRMEQEAKKAAAQEFEPDFTAGQSNDK